MTRSLSSPTTSASAATVTRPGYLVQIGFDDLVFLSSRGTVDVLGNEWTGWDVRISGLAHDSGNPAGGGTMTLGDADQSMSTLVLAQGLSGRDVTIWRYFAEAIDEADPVMVFDGLAGGVSGGHGRPIVVQLVARESTVLNSPRRRMTTEEGFHALPAAGQVMAFNNQKYVLEPER